MICCLKVDWQEDVLPSLIWRTGTDAHVCHDSRRLLDLCLPVSSVVNRESISLGLVSVPIIVAIYLISGLWFQLLDIHRLGQGLGP